MANKERGEFALKLGGRSLTLRPSFSAILAIEEKTGARLKVLCRSAATLELSYREMGIIVAEMAAAGAEEGSLATSYAPEKVAELIFEEGGATVTEQLIAPLMAALTGGVTATGEAKAVAKTKATTTAD